MSNHKDKKVSKKQTKICFFHPNCTRSNCKFFHPKTDTGTVSKTIESKSDDDFDYEEKKLFQIDFAYSVIHLCQDTDKLIRVWEETKYFLEDKYNVNHDCENDTEDEDIDSDLQYVRKKIMDIVYNEGLQYEDLAVIRNFITEIIIDDTNPSP